MSYILDALQKAEAERRSRDRRDPSLLEAPRAGRQANRNRRLLWALAAALCINAMLAALLWQQLNQESPQEAAEVTEPVPARALTIDTPDQPLAAESIAAPTETGSAPASRPQPSDQPQPLTLHTHVYASDPAWREVSINGQFYRTGDRIGSATLEAITTEGVRLRLPDRTVELAVGESVQP